MFNYICRPKINAMDILCKKMTHNFYEMVRETFAAAAFAAISQDTRAAQITESFQVQGFRFSNARFDTI